VADQLGYTGPDPTARALVHPRARQQLPGARQVAYSVAAAGAVTRGDSEGRIPAATSPRCVEAPDR
jgi:hypothetical protein